MNVTAATLSEEGVAAFLFPGCVELSAHLDAARKRAG
jgi:hypothetical protein